jgi:xanthine/CO dehydrogenase XdhC/CoxF family maturation factor
MKEIMLIVQLYERLKMSSTDMALASVVNIEESSYRRVGARMLVSAQGEWTGGISGGCLEGDALIKAQSAIHHNAPSIVRYDTMDDDDNQIGIGLGCNGIIDVLFTPIDISDAENEIELLNCSR